MRKFFCLAILVASMLSFGCIQKTTYMVYYDANNPERIEEPFLLDVKVTGKTKYNKEGSANAIEVGELLHAKLVENLKKENLYLTDYEQDINKYMLVVNIEYFQPGSAAKRALQGITGFGDGGTSVLRVEAYLSAIKKHNGEYIVANRIVKLPSGDTESAEERYGSNSSGGDPLIWLLATGITAAADMAEEASEGKGSSVIKGTAYKIVKVIKGSFISSKGVK